MSVHVTSAVWKMKVGDPEAKLVLLKLADNANDVGIAWPSQRTLARDCEVSPMTVNRRVKYLVDNGFLAIEEAGGPRRATTYRVLAQRTTGDTWTDTQRFMQGDTQRFTQTGTEPSVTVSNHQSGCTHESCCDLGRCQYEIDGIPMPKAAA